MIEPNEVRIGNIVRIAVNKDEHTDFPLTMKDFKTTKLKLFDPVPLTTEWLVKLGFVNAPKKREWQILGLFIEDFGFDTFCESRYGITLKHVHQLQNVYYALTKRELEINH